MKGLPLRIRDRSFMQFRNPTVPRIGLLAGTAAVISAALVAGLSAGQAQAQGQGQVRRQSLYTLETSCSIKGGPAQPCVVEAVDEGDATIYTHRIGKQVQKIRISDAPVSMSLWDPTSKSWVVLKSAGARFSTNTICFNGRDLCVVNPNYLNSVREEKTEALAGRDLVGVKFSPDGRVSLTCYDEACEGVQ
jgi:hypothetical protein